MVQIHPDPPVDGLGGCSSAGRAPALQAGGRRFDPDQLHQAPRETLEKIRAKRRQRLALVFSQKGCLFFNNLEEVDLTVSF